MLHSGHFIRYTFSPAHLQKYLSSQSRGSKSVHLATQAGVRWPAEAQAKHQNVE